MNPVIAMLDDMTVRALDLIESMTDADWQRPDVLLKPFERVSVVPVETPAPPKRAPRKPKRYRKKMNAREVILRHLMREPADMDQTARVLAKRLRVGHSTAGAVLKTLRDEDKTPAQMLAEIRSGQAAGGAR